MYMYNYKENNSYCISTMYSGVSWLSIHACGNKKNYDCIIDHKTKAQKSSRNHWCLHIHQPLTKPVTIWVVQ